MRNKCNMGSVVICAMAVMLGFATHARTFEFKQLNPTGSCDNSSYCWGPRRLRYSIKIGGASKVDDMSEMEIRAATVFKNVTNMKTGVNDVAKFRFDPINRGRAIYFVVSTGLGFLLRERELHHYDNIQVHWKDNVNTGWGWQLAGCIIEIWQNGKVVKHWSDMSGKGGNAKLTDRLMGLRINRDGDPNESRRYWEVRNFDNATEIFSVDAQGERVDINEVLKPFRGNETGSKVLSKGGDTSAAQAPEKNTVAPKLRTCEFLHN